MGEARGSVISSRKDLDSAKSPLSRGVCVPNPSVPVRQGGGVVLSHWIGGMEKSWWEPIITIAASSAIPHHEQLRWIWVIWGHSKMWDTRIGFPREKVRNKVGTRERRWKGTRGHIQSWGKKGGSYLPLLGASSSAGRGESGLLISKVKCQRRTLSQAGFMCPGCSNSS